MNKYLLSLAIGICLSLTSLAQVQRVILYEEFTGEDCYYCGLFNPFINATVHKAGNFPTKIVKINWQGDIPAAPGAGSLFQDNTTEVLTRQTYYNVESAPYATFNGIPLPDPSGSYGTGHGFLISDTTSSTTTYPLEYPTIIPDSFVVNAPFALTVNHVFNATIDSVTITAVITAAQSYTSHSAGSLVLQVAMEEAAVHFAAPTGTNGEKDFYDVMRKMEPSVSGTVLNNTWAPAATQTITIKAAIPSYIHDKSQLAFVAFVQDNGTKRVHQAAYSSTPLFAVDAGMSNAVVAQTCNDTVNLTMTLQNHGTSAITTCTVSYQLDGNAVVTQTFNGSLTITQTHSFALPTFTASVGTHTFVCYSSNPNNTTDAQPANDTTRITFTIYAGAALPIVEGFETTTSLPNSIWNTSHTTGGGTDFQVTSSAAASGVKSCMLNNLSNVAGNSSILETNSFYDMTTLTTPLMTFEAAYQQTATTNADKLQVLTSTDCGATWQSRKTITSSTLASLAGGTGTTPYVPTQVQFTTYTVAISAVASSHNVMFRWDFIADPTNPGNNLYIDNINIVDNAAGIENIETIVDLNIYPNPSASKVNIGFTLSASHNIAVTVTDMLGRTVETIASKSYQSGETRLTIGAENVYQAGVYMVNITVDGQRVAKKVIIQ
jgi:type IX secretion system substrate protein